jgi:aminopeptidase N
VSDGRSAQARRGLTERFHERCGGGAVAVGAAQSADAGASFVLRGTERVYERARPFRIDHLALSLEIDETKGEVAGTAELIVARVARGEEELRLDAVDFELLGVQTGGGSGRGKAKGGWRAARHVYDGEVLRVTVPAALTRFGVRVRYRARPRRGMYFLAPDEAVPHRPEQVWTQCQDEDARRIFPCHDKPHIKQTMELDARVRRGWFVLSNGELLSSRAEQKRGRYRYKMAEAMPSYLFTLVAGEFARIEDRVGDLPLEYYVPRGREEDAKRTFVNTPEMIRLFAKVTGVAYPWSRYAQVVVSDFIFGGMENTGATTLYEHVLLDERAAIDSTSDDLISHELAHQWFGDLVTCRDWSQAWLNEGFATFMEHVWREHHLGRDEYHQGLRVDLNAYLSEAAGRYQRPVVCQDYETPIDIFDRHLYEKGALFLHTLRLALGPELFWSGVRRYLEAYRHGVVETGNLMRALEEVSGQSLGQMFEQALLRAGHPRVDVAVEHDGGSLLVHARQHLDPDERPWAFELEIDITTAEGARPRRELRRVTRSSQTFALPLDTRPRFVVVDPELRILGKVSVKAPADMLRRQLAEAPTARGRALAADALASRDDVPTLRALAETLQARRAFWGVRVAAAHALGRIRSPDAFAELDNAVRTGHPKVRRAVVAAIGEFRTDEAAQLLAKVARDDDSLMVAASACRALGGTRRPHAYDELIALVDRESWADVLRAGALEGLAKLRDERAVEQVRQRTRYGIPSRGRRAAVQALYALSQSKRTREHLEELLEDTDVFVRLDAVIGLGEIGDAKARPALRRLLDRELDGRVRRRIREVLRDMGGVGRREAKRVRDEVEELRREGAELRARLSKLEDKLRNQDAAARKKKKRK